MRAAVLVPMVALAVTAGEALGQRPGGRVPSDSLSPVELVAEWEAEMSRPTPSDRPFPRSTRTVGITDALRSYRADPARAEAVRDELEKVVFGSSVPRVRCQALLRLTTGYRVSNPDDRAESADTRELARRLERIYGTIEDDPYIKRCTLSAVSSLGGSGRVYALNWLEPLIVQETEDQAFSKEAFEAMRTAVSLGRPGRVLVVRLREEGQIKDPEARFRSGFISVEGG